MSPTSRILTGFATVALVAGCATPSKSRRFQFSMDSSELAITVPPDLSERIIGEHPENNSSSIYSRYAPPGTEADRLCRSQGSSATQRLDNQKHRDVCTEVGRTLEYSKDYTFDVILVRCHLDTPQPTDADRYSCLTLRDATMTTVYKAEGINPSKFVLTEVFLRPEFVEPQKINMPAPERLYSYRYQELKEIALRLCEHDRFDCLTNEDGLVKTSFLYPQEQLTEKDIWRNEDRIRRYASFQLRMMDAQLRPSN